AAEQRGRHGGLAVRRELRAMVVGEALHPCNVLGERRVENDCRGQGHVFEQRLAVDGLAFLQMVRGKDHGREPEATMPDATGCRFFLHKLRSRTAPRRRAIHGNCSSTRSGLVAEILYKNRFPIRPIMRYMKANQWFERLAR